jgi:hypothetical protein
MLSLNVFRLFDGAPWKLRERLAVSEDTLALHFEA